MRVLDLIGGNHRNRCFRCLTQTSRRFTSVFRRIDHCSGQSLQFPANCSCFRRCSWGVLGVLEFSGVVLRFSDSVLQFSVKSGFWTRPDGFRYPKSRVFGVRRVDPIQVFGSLVFGFSDTSQMDNSRFSASLQVLGPDPKEFSVSIRELPLDPRTAVDRDLGC